MISYTLKEKYVAVKWKRTEIGRITQEGKAFYYSPRGCGGAVKSEPFASLTAVKKYIEGESSWQSGKIYL